MKSEVFGTAHQKKGVSRTIGWTIKPLNIDAACSETRRRSYDWNP
jgi:hypothetical protein